MAETSSDEKEMETSGQNEGGIPYKVKAGAFLAFAGGFGLLAGFGGALAQVSDCSVCHFYFVKTVLIQNLNFPGLY